LSGWYRIISFCLSCIFLSFPVFLQKYIFIISQSLFPRLHYHIK
jgi:hypothetical protein